MAPTFASFRSLSECNYQSSSLALLPKEAPWSLLITFACFISVHSTYPPWYHSAHQLFVYLYLSYQNAHFRGQRFCFLIVRSPCLKQRLVSSGWSSCLQLLCVLGEELPGFGSCIVNCFLLGVLQSPRDAEENVMVILVPTSHPLTSPLLTESQYAPLPWSQVSAH